ncbi:hypothetical protein PL75_03240 [Neisseria arctica]|uniref:Phage protein n=1 Tax=Neisseria arctica TaxID=1470200 RepID=A0A0J0YT08_9NEIS|nr:phage tail terminator-like protein [Neisseria arctica]KLT73254.1 hypothetical protein PL75_03240 [Neisseria arctica]UOO87492.1 DUF4128 domain-containing protein [Neisseria arctica]
MTEYQFKQAVLSLILGAGIVNDAQVDVPNSKSFRPPDGVWLRVGFSGAQGVFSGFGSRPCTRRTGLIMLQCFTCAEEYTKPLDELTDALVGLLEWHFADGYELQAAEVIDVGETENGAYYQKNVNIPFLIKTAA